MPFEERQPYTSPVPKRQIEEEITRYEAEHSISTLNTILSATVMLPLSLDHYYNEQNIPRLHPGPPLEIAPVKNDDSLTSSEQQKAIGGQDPLTFVIDDNVDAINLVKVALKDMPYTVIGIQDPLKAMKQVQELSPSAIILDVMLPGLNGWQILHQLKNDPATTSIPVIMLTVLSEQTTRPCIGGRRLCD